MFFSNEQINQIRDKARIEDIIKRYVPSLTQKGRNWVGLCPFHKEKSPSFTVFPEKQSYYCFGCHKGGNVFNFVSEYENINFPESVRKIAESLGIVLQELNGGDNELTVLRDINQLAAKTYNDFIKNPEGIKGKTYLLDRGVTEQSIADFQLGYAPDDWHFLANIFIKNKITPEKGLLLGLLSETLKNDKRHIYDKFRSRVIFPINDENGNCIAFGGRITGEGEPKYLNSPETPLFKKRNVLYAFDRAKSSIKENKRAIIVEGYLDVIGCHQAGFTNVVAPLGTALTIEQLKMLTKYCTEIIFLYDSDNAGLKAALRSVELAKDLSINVKVAVLPSGDPFEYITEKGIREFLVVVDSAVSPAEFKMNQIFKKHVDNDPVKLMPEILQFLKEVELATERDICIKKIADKLKIAENSLKEDYKNFADKNIEQKTTNVVKIKPKEVKISDFFTKAYRQLIQLLCNYPELIEKAVIDFPENEITDPISRNLYQKIIELHANGDNISVGRLFDYFSSGSERIFLEEIVKADFVVDNPNTIYTEIYINLKLYVIDEKIKKFSQQILLNSNNQLQKEYLLELEVLRREREKLNDYVYNKLAHQ